MGLRTSVHIKYKFTKINEKVPFITVSYEKKILYDIRESDAFFEIHLRYCYKNQYELGNQNKNAQRQM